MLRDFTAIDFETANRYPTSACSIGIVVVQDGEITEEFSHLIKPEPYYFNKKFIEIHGITPVMVKDAPSIGFIFCGACRGLILKGWLCLPQCGV